MIFFSEFSEFSSETLENPFIKLVVWKWKLNAFFHVVLQYFGVQLPRGVLFGGAHYQFVRAGLDFRFQTTLKRFLKRSKSSECSLALKKLLIKVQQQFNSKSN